MLNARFDQVRTILCIGAHADDIEIGCGGTLIKLLEQYSGINVCWAVLSSDERRADEARCSARQFLAAAAETQVHISSFRDGYFPYEGAAIKDYFFELRDQVAPDLILTHRREDLHQDHRLVAELTWNTFRDHLIFEYEIPKYEGDLGNPNLFVPLDESTCRRKIEAIIANYPTQHEKGWFNDQTFWSLLRLRGIEAGSSSSFAEAFHCRKMIL
jgi:LmbE family N-acetylglucosaminyl deacetylase